MDVLDEDVAAAARGQDAPLGCGSAEAVADLVVPADGVAPPHEVAGELVVAPDVLRHAVDQLDYGAGLLSHAPPDVAVDAGDLVRGVEPDLLALDAQ